MDFPVFVSFPPHYLQTLRSPLTKYGNGVCKDTKIYNANNFILMYCKTMKINIL